MDLLLNELSFHGQFQDIPAFKAAIDRVMLLRQLARRFGREIHCHRSLANAQVTHAQTLQQVVQAFEMDERRALMQWFARQGPYWEDVRLHSTDDYLEYKGEPVTDTALGEAAFGVVHGQERRLTSLTPSAFELSPLPVTWTTDDGLASTVDVHNHWTVQELEAVLQAAPPAIDSWDQLAAICRGQCDALTFSEDCFAALRGHPFVDGAARHVLVLLDVLHRFSRCFDGAGQRTPEGQRLYQDHFTGGKAWFSDSSDAEKEDFRSDLTFKHPTAQGETLFCTWHGKVKTPQIRIHFSWPVRANEPLYVVYVGPKITKR
ncbi:hypothetical protein [Comamonas sp.]|uniref:hypothetical protein n=1 Tax=Comamonas sp. TaxID=34028 RepID=UPI00289FD69C|nr:hypothetical protein [Comamonas sp.]